MFDKGKLFKERGRFCECGCRHEAHDAHHALIHRMKKYPELDCEENIILVNHYEHIARTFDTLEWRRFFWKRQVKRYGKEHMEAWLARLPDKLKHRKDFVNE